MQVKRTVVVTAVVTEKLKAELCEELQNNLDRISDAQKELEQQSRRYMLQMPSADLATAFRKQVEQEARRHEAAKGEIQSRLDEVQALKLGDRIPYTSLEEFMEVKVGDDLVAMLSRGEILIEDGKVLEITE
ncbi:MAG TPA: YlqD family protein [Armatimonadota bacterium]|jgi:hypothetical protein